jgi:hypothetical protein
MKQHKLLLPPSLAASIAVILLFGSNCGTREPRNGRVNVTIDLNKTAPIGYEFFADKPPKLARGNLDLRLQMPERIEIPPNAHYLNAKYVEFRPGEHEVDVYRDLRSPRVLYTRGSLAMEEGVPTIRVRLETNKLSKGKYVLGISGDPFFAYCTVDLQ